ncbi:HD domain-containing phosphohydrolase [Lacrimispora sp.]|jgi:diguanylate cyclase (GGDEF)-like protein/PAS domain S-box-containing protein|uniref:HD domain-containing phosphohydrolase n=1 Tax=Lacrimispora sp. TaxID=2719234 RepID=UPI00289B0B4D|nr:HD domain-containing phosphohydrolase [Lacrimispora sp.]
MTKEGRENFFMQMPLGYAYYEIIIGSTERAREYVLAEANDAFFDLWSLDKEKAFHNNVSLLLKDEAKASAWHTFHEHLGNAEKEKHFTVIIGKRSFKVTVYTPAPDGLAAIFDEITEINGELESQREINERLTREIDIFFNSTQDGLFFLEYKNGEFRYIRNNSVHQKLTGMTIPLMEGKTPIEAMGDDVGGILQEGYKKCVATGVTIMYEETVEFKGSPRDWLVRLTPVKENGKVSYIIGSRLDITELKKLREDKEQLLENLNSMFTEHSAVMLIIDMKTGKILNANPSACRFYGYTREEILAMHIQDISETSNDAIKRMRVQNHNNEKPYSLFTHRLKSGEVKMVDVYSSPITYEGENQLFSIIFDVSDREKFRYDLYWDNELLSVTLNSIGDGVVTTDNEGKVTYLNQAAQEITGWNNETASERPFEEIFDLRNEATGESISNPISAVLKTGKIVGLANHTVLLNRQGDFIPITDSAAPIKDQTGHMYGVVMVFHDVSHEKRQQRRIMYLSYHDSLTEIFNRRYIEEEMIRIDRASMLPIAVIMGDVNGLKVTNDVFGHKTGDLLLKEVAKTFQHTIQKNGIAGRWGGDEFLILLPKTDTIKAQDIIQQLEEEFKKNDRLPLQISVSLGFDVKHSVYENLHQILQKAEEQMYHKKLLEGKSWRNRIINTLLATLHEKSMETEEHALRIETYCIAMAEKLDLAPEEKNDLALLSMLHDIGKVGISMEILKKPGPLSDEEWKEVKRHPEIGYRIAQNTPELSTVSEYILSHHERWDGTGYPRGLKENEIPLLCRILAVADAYDAMTSNLVYRMAMDSQNAMEEIRRCAGTQFDPSVAELFLELNKIY